MRIPMGHSRRAGFISLSSVGGNLVRSICAGAGLEIDPLALRADLSKLTAPQLRVHGEKDTQVPIEDLYIVLRSSTIANEAWINPTGGHIGRNIDLSDARNFGAGIVPWFARMLK
jgi:fermentation-respiration switch protein FrsA (DUF1100 family)